MKSTFDRSDVENILSEKLNNYIKEFESDVKLEELNIHDKALCRSSLAAKWCRYEYEEKRFKDHMMASLETLKEDAKEKLFEKKKQAIENKIINQSMINIEVERIIKQLPAYQKIKKTLEDQDEVLRFISEAKHIISQFGFDIKNAIEVLKLENI